MCDHVLRPRNSHDTNMAVWAIFHNATLLVKAAGPTGGVMVAAPRGSLPHDPGRGFDENWREVRDDGAIQYAPVNIPKSEPSTPPDWLKDVVEVLGRFFAGIGGQWYWLQWVLLVMASALLIYLIVRIVDPDWFKFSRRKAKSANSDEPEWVPSEHDAKALLGDADALAAQGDYDGATHLLLLRSVEQIAQARPDLVEPSSTARELGALAFLPGTARRAFAAISERVERSLFALQGLNRDDWEAARAAYAQFALDNSDANMTEITS